MAEQAALADLGDYGITDILRTALPERAALRRMTFESRAVISGPIGHTIDAMIAELCELGALAQLAARGDMA